MPATARPRVGVTRAAGPVTLAALAALVLCSTVASAATEIYRATIDASQEVPTNPSLGKGLANLSYNTGTRILSYNISFAGLSGPETAAHIHGPALAGVNAGVRHSLPLGTPKIGAVGPLTPADETSLRAGRLYINIHSTPFPGGEIRGQIDRQYDFARTYLTMDIAGPGGNRIGLVGPTSVVVRNGFLRDSDGDGLEQVPIEIVSMSLTGFDPGFGPVAVSLRPATAHPLQKSVGDAEEVANTTPGALNTPLTSFFDVFVQVDLPAIGQQFHNDIPVRLNANLVGIPPIEGESYLQAAPVPVVDLLENPTPYQIANTRHYPVPLVEHDFFPSSKAIIQIQGALNEIVTLSGPTEVDVQLTPADTDADGLEEVPTEMISMNLSGMSSVGPVTVTLRPPAADPFQRTLGEIEEDANTGAARLDLPPFAPGGTAHSFFDVFFEITAAGATYHNHVPKHVSATITFKPPAPGDVYEDPTIIPLFDASDAPAPIYLGAVRHIPNPGTNDVPIGRPPSALAIARIQPNPTRGGTSITMALPAAGRARLLVYDVNGRLVRQLLDGPLPAGLRTVTWDTRDDRDQQVAAGVYFVRLESGGGLSARRLVVLEK
jgi:hypothetical protein